jgi:predicted oxidoreductase
MWNSACFRKPRQYRKKHYDYSKSNLLLSLQNSLKTYTDYLMFLLHRPSPLMQADEIAEGFETEIRRKNY